MEHGLIAPFDGMVAELSADAGAQVQVDAVLARIEAFRGLTALVSARRLRLMRLLVPS